MKCFSQDKILILLFFLLSFNLLSCNRSVLLCTNNEKCYKLKGNFNKQIKIENDLCRLKFSLKSIDSMFISSEKFKVKEAQILYPALVWVKDSVYKGMINCDYYFYGKNDKLELKIPIKSINYIKKSK